MFKQPEAPAEKTEKTKIAVRHIKEDCLRFYEVDETFDEVFDVLNGYDPSVENKRVVFTENGKRFALCHFDSVHFIEEL